MDCGGHWVNGSNSDIGLYITSTGASIRNCSFGAWERGALVDSTARENYINYNRFCGNTVDIESDASGENPANANSCDIAQGWDEAGENKCSLTCDDDFLIRKTLDCAGYSITGEGGGIAVNNSFNGFYFKSCDISGFDTGILVGSDTKADDNIFAGMNAIAEGYMSMLSGVNNECGGMALPISGFCL
jgi:hypothetical protein